MAGSLTKVGRYQVVSELGRGSMGVVYQGFDPVIGRTIAIKTMLTEGLAPAEFQEFKARFQREAQAAGALAHPNIVTVYDFGEEAGMLYLAMEFLEGKSVQEIVEQQNILPIETIVPMYEQVCSALDHAHAHKIVHRDIKPANIMILDSGIVKVTDFGIAKMMSMGMTQAGQVLGTPNYMSPEQVKGRPVDGRSDIFSLGVILYELVTGEKPFGGQNITTVIYKIINENPIPPRELDSTIHPGLSSAISKALAKSPDERYQTCCELAEDLKNYKSLGGSISPAATVVIKVPLIPQPPAREAGAPSVVQRPQQVPQPQAAPQVAPPAEAPRPLSVQVIPPAKPHPKGTSPVVWVLGTILFLGALGGGYYYFFMMPKVGTQQVAVAPPKAPETAPLPASAPPQATNPATNPAPAQEAPTVAPETGAPEQPEAQPVKPAMPTVPGAEPSRASRVAAPKFGGLIVTSNIQGARISIDNQGESAWVTPHTFSDLPAGTHFVTVAKDGYESVQQSVMVEGGHTASLRAQLTVPSGEINIVTNPPGVEILIDGRSYGPSPVRATVNVGPHTYTVKRPGMDPYESNFDMKNGAIITRKVNLGGGAAVPTGIVEVRTIPPGATVFADGSAIGGQTPTSFRLATGHHKLTISLTGYRPIRRDVDVPGDGSIKVNEVLPRQ